MSAEMKTSILSLAMLPFAALAWRAVSLDAGESAYVDGEAAAVAAVSECDDAPHTPKAWEVCDACFVLCNGRADLLGGRQRRRSRSWHYAVPGHSATNLFMTSVQTFALSPNGDFTVGKFGYTATRGTNGVQQVTGGGN